MRRPVSCWTGKDARVRHSSNSRNKKQVLLHHFTMIFVTSKKKRFDRTLKFYDTFFFSRLMYQMILRSQQSTNTVAKETSTIKRGLKSVKQALSRKKASPKTMRPSPDKVTIEVKDFEVGVFERLMRYIHCGVVAVDPRTVAGQAFENHILVVTDILFFFIYRNQRHN